MALADPLPLAQDSIVAPQAGGARRDLAGGSGVPAASGRRLHWRPTPPTPLLGPLGVGAAP